TPNETNMEMARDNWLTSHSAYEQTALHLYLAANNVIEAQNLNLFQFQYRIDHWPILPGYVDYVDGYSDSGIVFDTSVAIEEDSILQLHGTFDISEAAIGFHVVEFLLWGENFAGVAPRPFSDYQPQDTLSAAQSDSGLTVEQLPNNRRRRLLLLTTELLLEEFVALQSNWETISPQLQQQIQGMDSAGILSMLIEAISTNLTEEFLVQSLYPLLNGNFEEGIHSPFSYSTQNTMAAQLSTVENLLLEQTSSNGTTLDSILASLSDDFAGFFYSNFDASKECLVVLYSNVEEFEDVQNNPQSEFEIVECINLLTNIIDYLEQVRFNISI
ncbi:MAG: imelysin family protein, partial [Gammaproteobacteria bacterium]